MQEAKTWLLHLRLILCLQKTWNQRLHSSKNFDAVVVSYCRIILKMSDHYHNKQRFDDAEDVRQYMINRKEVEPMVCKYFACGKHLSLEEIRFGDKCREHSIKKQTDILNVIKLK